MIGKRFFLLTGILFVLGQTNLPAVVNVDEPHLATTQDAADTHVDSQAIDDPFEDFNRAMFEINLALDRLLLRPVADLYDVTVPDPLQATVHNALANLSTPLVFVNDVLQLEGERAMESFARFVVNTVFGFLGLFDIASEIGIPSHSEDFGQTLASYGMEGGGYLMLPILGATNPRDLIGRVVDYLVDPFNLVMFNNDGKKYIYGRTLMDLVDRRANARDFTDHAEATAVDLYGYYRAIYLQHRAYVIGNEQSPNVDDSPRPDME